MTYSDDFATPAMQIDDFYSWVQARYNLHRREETVRIIRKLTGCSRTTVYYWLSGAVTVPIPQRIAFSLIAENHELKDLLRMSG